jgi:2-hydroxychromene-2-carboxylate isomerase/predicted thioesterase
LRAPDVGLIHELRVEPTPSETAAAVGNHGVAVVSTPALILYIEQAGRQLIDAFLEDGEAPLGVLLNVKHLGAAVVGRPVLARAEVASVEVPRVTFAVEAWQEGKLLMRGSYAQYIVGLAGFLSRQGLKPMARRRLDFWFDVGDPWCYLASRRVPTLAERCNLDVRWRPLSGRLLAEAVGTPAPSPAQADWQRRDLGEWAAAFGVVLVDAGRAPPDSTAALQAALQAEVDGQGARFALRVMQACWAEDADIADPALLAGWAAEFGLGGIRESGGRTALAAGLERNLREALASGVFGLPSLTVEGRLYYGVDRLDLLERWLLATAISPGS